MAPGVGSAPQQIPESGREVTPPKEIQGAVAKRSGMDPEQTSGAPILLFPQLKCKYLENKSSVLYVFLSHTMTTSVPYYSEGAQKYLLISLNINLFVK